VYSKPNRLFIIEKRGLEKMILLEKRNKDLDKLINEVLRLQIDIMKYLVDDFIEFD